MLSTDLTVGTLVEQDNRFLTIEERVSGAMVVTQPGGHIEAGETPEVAAARETLEESGCRVVVQELVGVYLWVHPDNYRQHLRIVFFAKLLEQQLELRPRRGYCRRSLVIVRGAEKPARVPAHARRHALHRGLSVWAAAISENVLRNLTPPHHNVGDAGHRQ